MPFTAQELENIANSAIDFHAERRKVTPQTLQDKPLLRALRAKQKTFPGGKDNITFRVKFDYTTGIQGFSHDDVVDYDNPANTKTASYPYKMIHGGISFTMDELIRDGITIVDSVDGKSTSQKSDREMTALANMLDEKLDDMEEGMERGFNLMFWRDGTQDPNLVPGVRSIVVNDPTAASVVGGIDQSAVTDWRNRASLGLSTATPSNLVIASKLQQEYRQLRRYGGNPDTWLAGSDFLDALEDELRSKGDFTNAGWAKNGGRIDMSVADIEFKGKAIEYDPTLDDLGLTKYLFAIDTRHLYPMVVDGEDMKKHNPARPENKYVFYRAKTWVGGLVARRRNVHGVYSID